MRRRALLAAALLPAPALPLPALAQLPGRPLRLVVPWSAGGTTDVQMRAFGEALTRHLGQPVVVDNKPGAGGMLGPQALLHEKPDGSVLCQMAVSVLHHAILAPRPAFDALRDFTWVIGLTGYLFGVVVKPDAPWANFAELMADAERNPGRLSYGTSGIGSTQHITMERITRARALDWLHVPYKGVAETVQAVLAGQVDAAAASSVWSAAVRQGSLRLLCTWGAERAPRFADVPTLRESGLDIVSESPYGLAGPRGMDPGLVRALHEALNAALHDPAHLAVLQRLDMPLRPMNPAAYTAFVHRQFEEDRAMFRALEMGRQ